MNKIYKRIIFALFAISFLVVAGVCNANIKIQMLNVGQGDAILIRTGEQTVLIDASDVDETDKLLRELGKAGIGGIDKLILTHPHADHIGGVSEVIKYYSPKVIIDNGINSNSALYKKYATLGNVNHVKAGDLIDLGGGATFEVLNPTALMVEAVNAGRVRTDPNNESIVGRLMYGRNFRMLFTGDLERKVERVLIENPSKLDAKVLKAGHHGSRGSSDASFLLAVNPEYILISAGEPTDKRGGNTYGHPHREFLLRAIGRVVDKNHILWTHMDGTITIDTDGNGFTVTAEHKVDWIDQYLNAHVTVEELDIN